jgi:hypothetical protein
MMKVDFVIFFFLKGKKEKKRKVYLSSIFTFGIEIWLHEDFYPFDKKVRNIKKSFIQTKKENMGKRVSTTYNKQRN